MYVLIIRVVVLIDCVIVRVDCVVVRIVILLRIDQDPCTCYERLRLLRAERPPYRDEIINERQRF